MPMLLPAEPAPAAPSPDRAFRLLLGGMIAAGAVKLAFVLHHLVVTPPAGRGDFLGLWSFGLFARTRPVMEIYRPAVLHHFLAVLLHHKPPSYPFPYPPSALPLFWPLGLMPLPWAEALWLGLGLIFWLAALAHWFGRGSGVALLACLTAPIVLEQVAPGETGFLTAALLIGGVSVLPKRPVLAGVFFGLLTIKPQLGLLIPAALIGLGAWRTIAAACVTVALMVFVSCLVFPPELWAAWIAGLGPYQAMFEGASHHLLPILATPLAALRLAGVAVGPARAAQAVVSGVLVMATYLAFRRVRAAPGLPLAAAALFVATPLASPHAFLYDSLAVPVAAAMLLKLRLQRGQPNRVLLLVLLASYVAPLTILTPWLQAPPFALAVAPLAILLYREVFRATSPWVSPAPEAVASRMIAGQPWRDRVDRWSAHLRSSR